MENNQRWGGVTSYCYHTEVDFFSFYNSTSWNVLFHLYNRKDGVVVKSNTFHQFIVVFQAFNERSIKQALLIICLRLYVKRPSFTSLLMSYCDSSDNVVGQVHWNNCLRYLAPSTAVRAAVIEH